jgi:hypothetical protein
MGDAQARNENARQKSKRHEIRDTNLTDRTSFHLHMDYADPKARRESWRISIYAAREEQSKQTPTVRAQSVVDPMSSLWGVGMKRVSTLP